MPSDHVTITLTADTPISARVQQCAGMFDAPITDKTTRTWTHHLPIEDQPWQVGLIVGPSGAGKSVLANKLWPGLLRERWDWPTDRALIDGFPENLSIRDITSTLTAVGLGTVPAWMRPYSTLSNGERFRADMARTLLTNEDIAVIDEFTSVVDRQVAKIASHCVQKTVRRGNKQFVAVTCHYDVEDWLQPDWIYDVSTQEFTWRQVQPHPAIQLEIHKSSTADWPIFSHHHYMSGSIHSAAQCFTAYINGKPVAFTSYIHFPHARTRNIKIGHRLVVLPDWQGIGLATVLENWLGEHLYKQGYRYRNVVAHPAMIRLYSRSPRWRSTGAGKVTKSTKAMKIMRKRNTDARRMAVHSFEYCPEKREQ